MVDLEPPPALTFEDDPCLGAVFRDKLHRCYQLPTTKGLLQFVSRVRTGPNHLLSARPCRRERDPFVPVPNLERPPERQLGPALRLRLLHRRAPGMLVRP